MPTAHSTWSTQPGSLESTARSAPNSFSRPRRIASVEEPITSLAPLSFAICSAIRPTPELAPFYDREELPGADARTDDELMHWARQQGSTVFHLIGACRMGPASDPTAVVDDRLRVQGVEGLRVADSSIMPSMPSANTNASTLMIAEKAADMILGHTPPPAFAAYSS